MQIESINDILVNFISWRNRSQLQECDELKAGTGSKLSDVA